MYIKKKYKCSRCNKKWNDPVVEWRCPCGGYLKYNK